MESTSVEISMDAPSAAAAEAGNANNESDLKSECALQAFKAYKKSLLACIVWASTVILAVILTVLFYVIAGWAISKSALSFLFALVFVACVPAIIGVFWKCPFLLLPFIQLIVGGLFWADCIWVAGLLDGSIKSAPFWTAVSGGIWWVHLAMVVLLSFFCYAIGTKMLFHFWFAFMGMTNYPTFVHRLAVRTMFSPKSLTMADKETLLKWTDGKLKKWW